MLEARLQMGKLRQLVALEGGRIAGNGFTARHAGGGKTLTGFIEQGDKGQISAGGAAQGFQRRGDDGFGDVLGQVLQVYRSLGPFHVQPEARDLARRPELAGKHIRGAGIDRQDLSG